MNRETGILAEPARRVGMLICTLGWHQRPFVLAPRPAEMTPEDYQFQPRYQCERCGLVGRIDGQDNLAPLHDPL